MRTVRTLLEDFMIREEVFRLPIRAVARVLLLLAFLGALAAWPVVAQYAHGSATSGVWLVALKGEDEPSSLKRPVGSAGKVVKEEVMEPDVCTCCPTSMVRTARGLLVDYRGHTPKNIRDIGVKRLENGNWLPAKNLNPDNWEINACPVNGESAAAKNNRVAIAWHTEGGDKPRVQLVFSLNGGATFSKPITVNTGDALGHPSTVQTNDGGAFVSWIEEGEKSPWGNSTNGKVQTARLVK